MLIDESRTADKYTSGSAAGRGTPTEILIHHWGVDGQTHEGIVEFFERKSTGTSAHFVVSAGRIHCIVSPQDVAWHAGDWSVNLRSIGIECRPEATDADYAAVAWLIAHLRETYGPMPLRPHNKYASTACPGRYDLARLDAEARNSTTTAPLSNNLERITEGFLMALSETDQQEILLNIRKLVKFNDGELSRDKADTTKIDEVVANVRKIVWNTTEAKALLQASPPADLAKALDAAGIASQVRDELAKLIGGKQ